MIFNALTTSSITLRSQGTSILSKRQRQLSLFATAAFGPQNTKELSKAVQECIKQSKIGDCSAGLHGPIGSWDVSAVTDMGGMFAGAIAFNQDLSAWDVAAVRDMSGMFSAAHSFDKDLSAWDVSAVTTMWGMFANAHSFNQELSTWNVSGVTIMSGMFAGADSFNQNLSAWDVAAVTDMNDMFRDATSFDQILCGVSWVSSKAKKGLMFAESSGSICHMSSSYVCPLK